MDRANYGRLKPVLQSIAGHPKLELQIVAAGTMVLERFGQAVEVVKPDGFQVDGEIYIELEGSTPATMAKSVGFAMLEFASEFQRLKPDVVLLIGDRYEALAAAIAAAYMNIALPTFKAVKYWDRLTKARVMRFQKFAHFHFPSTARSAQYLIQMGERPDTIMAVGCPSSDIARTMDRTADPSVINQAGSGAFIDVSRPFLLVVFHPTTTEYGGELQQMEALLGGLGRLAMQTVLLWPTSMPARTT